MILSLQVSNEEYTLIRKFTELKGLDISDFILQSVLEQIENEIDLKCYEEAMAEYKANPVTYSLEEIENEFQST